MFFSAFISFLLFRSFSRNFIALVLLDSIVCSILKFFLFLLLLSLCFFIFLIGFLNHLVSDVCPTTRNISLLFEFTKYCALTDNSSLISIQDRLSVLLSQVCLFHTGGTPHRIEYYFHIIRNLAKSAHGNDLEQLFQRRPHIRLLLFLNGIVVVLECLLSAIEARGRPTKELIYWNFCSTGNVQHKRFVNVIDT